MSLTEPGVGVTLSPQWALLMNANMAAIDQHNHTTGQGVLIPVAGLDINADLPMAGFNVTMLNSAVFNGAVTGTPAALSLFSNGTDLFYKDVNGNVIRLTEGGSPASGTGNIQGLPSTPTGDAGILWVNAQSTFQMLQDNGTVGANVDMGTAVLRYPGSYPTPSGTNWIALKVPTSIAAGYSLTLPPEVPATADALLKANASGVESFLSLGAANTVLRVNSGGTALEYHTVDTANITDQAVTSAKIASGAIGPTQLASATSATASFSSKSTTSSVTVGTLDFTASGLRPVLVQLQGNTTANVGFEVTDDTWQAKAVVTITDGTVGNAYYNENLAGTALGTTITARIPTNFSFLYFPTAGTRTYTVTLVNQSLGGVSSAALDSSTLIILEL